MNNVVSFSAEAAVDGNTLHGVAHVYGKRAFVGGHYETFAANAFDKALEKSDVRAFYQHNPQLLLGRQSSGTLRLTSGKKGLEYEIDLPETSYANDLKELVKRGDLNEMSFGFIPGEYEWAGKQSGIQVRMHTNVKELVDVSPVSIPAFEGTSLNLRDIQGYNTPRMQIIMIRSKLRARHEIL